MNQDANSGERVTMVNENGTSKYANQAMLVKLSIAKWTAIKTDDAVTVDVVAQYLAEKESGAFKKKLISRTDPDFKAINKSVSDIRTFHKHMTLPWDKSGRDLLPAKAFLRYKQRMTELEDQFYVCVKNFCDNYSQKLNNAQAMLGNMFQASDYPAVDEIQGMYGVDLTIEPIPQGENLKVGISQQFLDEERVRIENEVQVKVKTAHKSLYKRLESVANQVITTLSKDEPNFRRSFIKNVMETADILEMLDLENDGELHASAERLKEAVTKSGFHTLKEDESARKEVIKDVEGELDAITKAVNEMA